MAVENGMDISQASMLVDTLSARVEVTKGQEARDVVTGKTVELGRVRGGARVVYTNLRFNERAQVGEQLLTGRIRRQPALALVEGTRITQIAYGADLLGVRSSLRNVLVRHLDRTLDPLPRRVQ